MGRVSVSVSVFVFPVFLSDFCFFAKGQNSAALGNDYHVVPRLTQATAILFTYGMLL